METGELSAFHGAFGFYVHGVPIDTAVLPTGWEERAIEVRNENTRNYTGGASSRMTSQRANW